mmetsp:Transcript_30716/g.36162  ORF Transcript_30716/g.36162 Transcript_30716/m.36162 type:complete len:304 (+) Transcript_30716:1781-2692(+)
MEEHEKYNQLEMMVNDLINLEDFASGRDVITWSNEIVKQCAKAKTKIATHDMLQKSLDIILKHRNPKQIQSSSSSSSLSSSSSGGGGGGGGHIVAPQAISNPQNAVKFTTTIDIKQAEEVEVEVDDGRSGHDNENDDDPIYAALQKTCVDLGYDDNLQQREKLEKILDQIEKGKINFPEDIINHIIKLTNGKVDSIIKILKPQIPKLKLSIHKAILTELKEIARIVEEERKHQEALKKAADDEKARKKLEAIEVKRKADILKQKELQQKAQNAGICPAGFTFHREGCGWRCNGGSHYVADRDL